MDFLRSRLGTLPPDLAQVVYHYAMTATQQRAKKSNVHSSDRLARVKEDACARARE